MDQRKFKVQPIQGIELAGEPLKKELGRAFEAYDGVLRLAPNWVPRSFLQPGRRLKLAPDNYYALGKNRGGIDERWFASTTEAANEDRMNDEGLSYVVSGKYRFTLREAVQIMGADIVGRDIWARHHCWPVYSKFFDNMGPIPHHLHQNDEQAALVGRKGKPESYYFPPQLNAIGNNFPHTYFGLEPSTTLEQIIKCLECWNSGDNGILDLAKAYRLKPGTGWLVGPCILHAPGSLVTWEPQWGSDVFGMYQSLVEGRDVPWSLLVKDMPEDKHQDLEFIAGQIDLEGNTDPNFKDHHYLEPIPDVDAGIDPQKGYDLWVTYGRFRGKQLFSSKELTVFPGHTVTLKDKAASGAIVMQGRGNINGLRLECPAMIRFGDMSEDEVFITDKAARAGVTIVSEGDVPLVILRYFGPDAHSKMPDVGDHSKFVAE